MKSYTALIADILARELLHNHKSRKRYSSLYADALEEIKNMSTEFSKTSTVTSSMNVADTPASRTPIGREIPDSPASLAAVAPGRLTREASSDSINSGMSIGSQLPAPAAKPVGHKALEGSNQGDHRIPAKDGATAAIDAIRNAGGPRDARGQFKNSRNDDGGAFQQTVDPTDAAN